jgi:hypothetical protein
MTDMRTVLDAIDNPRVAQARVLPVLFVVEHDPSALAVLISDLSRRFGNDFEVSGRTSPDAALTALRNLATAERPVALLLVDGAASEELLACAHRVHPQAKRVLLVDRDYSSASPAVHHDPTHDDKMLDRLGEHARRVWEGMGHDPATVSLAGEVESITI